MKIEMFCMIVAIVWLLDDAWSAGSKIRDIEARVAALEQKANPNP